MIATIATPINQIELTPGSAIQINGVSWDDYLALLQQLGDQRSTRIAYDRGILEIRMSGQPHETINRLLAAIALTLAEELGFEFNDLGSMTMNRAALGQGVEPDSCFYIQNAKAGQGLGYPITSELPPDLAIEVDIANRSDSKLEIYQAMGVPEIWLYHRDTIAIRHLIDGTYTSNLYSLAFPTVSATQLDQWVELRKAGTDLTVVRAARQFCRELNLQNRPI
jgi:Uma2 family endonuclease